MIVNGVDLIESECRVCVNQKRDGHFEPSSFRVWLEECKPGKVALDIGSYTGVYAIGAAKAGAIAVAYEPNPVVFARLLENIASNNVKVDARQKAAFHSDGQVEFYYRFDMTSAGRLTAKDGYHRTMVKAELIREDRPVSVVKVDVEGSEVVVLTGLEPVLKRDRPVVIAESLSPGKQEKLDKFMNSLGYTGQSADRRNIVYRHDSAC